MNVQCPNCKARLTIDLDPISSIQAKMKGNAERDRIVAQERAAGDIEVERLRRQQRVAKEARKTCKELAKARKVAQQAISKNQEAAQQGVNIGPTLTTALQGLVEKLIDAENYAGALS